MPLRGDNSVRITRSERRDLEERAGEHGQAEYIPETIKEEGDLEAAESIADGEAIIPDLYEFATTGSSPHTRGERSAEELFGQPLEQAGKADSSEGGGGDEPQAPVDD